MVELNTPLHAMLMVMCIVGALTRKVSAVLETLMENTKPGFVRTPAKQLKTLTTLDISKGLSLLTQCQKKPRSPMFLRISTTAKCLTRAITKCTVGEWVNHMFWAPGTKKTALSHMQFTRRCSTTLKFVKLVSVTTTLLSCALLLTKMTKLQSWKMLPKSQLQRMSSHRWRRTRKAKSQLLLLSNSNPSLSFHLNFHKVNNLRSNI